MNARPLLLTLLALAPLPVLAAVDCRMPNGKVVTFGAMAACPADAAQLDARGNVVRPAAKPAAPAKSAAPIRPAAPLAEIQRTPARPSGVPLVANAAQALCQLVRQRGLASECAVHVNFLSTSSVDLTVNTPLSKARSECLTVAVMLRQATPEDARASAWEVRLFSPFSGSRPIAVCDV